MSVVTVTTDALGRASVTVPNVGPLAGDFPIIAFVPGVTGTPTWSLSVTPDVAFYLQPADGFGVVQNALPASTFTINPTVLVTDHELNPTPGAVVVFTPGGGSSIATATATANSLGYASGGKWTAASGAATLVVTASGLTAPPGLSYPVTFSAFGSLATHVTPTAGTGQTGIVAGQTAPVVLEWTVANAGGTGVPGVTVPLSVSGGGSISSPSAISDASGKIFATLTTGLTVGVNAVTASPDSLASSPSTISTTTVAGAATKLGIVVAPDVHGISNTALAQQPTIGAMDANGNVNTASTAVVTASIASGSGIIGGTVASTATAGLAVYTNLKVTGASTVTLGFSSPGLTGVTSGPIVIGDGAGQPNHLAVTVQPPTAVGIGQGFAMSVAVEDVNNAILTNDASPVTATLSVLSGTATMTGSATVSCTAGVASFTETVGGTAGAVLAVVFSRSGITSATSSQFTLAAALTTNEPAGMTDIIVDLSAVTPDTPYLTISGGASNFPIANRKWGIVSGKTFKRLISKPGPLIAACPSAGQMLVCPNGSDFVETTEFGGSTTFPAGDQSNGTFAPPTNIKSAYYGGYIWVSANYRGHVAGPTKVFYFHPANQGNGSCVLVLYGHDLTPVQFRFHYGAVNYTDIPATVNVARGAWHFLEALLVKNSAAGVLDGHATLFVDRVKVHQRTDVNWGSDLTWNGSMQDIIYFGGVGDTSVPDKQYIARGDLSRFAYSTSRIAAP